jgi:hypothetical protein
MRERAPRCTPCAVCDAPHSSCACAAMLSQRRAEPPRAQRARTAVRRCAQRESSRGGAGGRAGGRKRLRVGRVEAVVEMAAHTSPAHVPHTHTNKETRKQTQTPAATATATTRRGYGWRLENKEREGLKAGQGFNAATGCAVAMQCIGPLPAAGMGCGEPRASYTEYGWARSE